MEKSQDCPCPACAAGILLPPGRHRIARGESGLPEAKVAAYLARWLGEPKSHEGQKATAIRPKRAPAVKKPAIDQLGLSAEIEAAAKARGLLAGDVVAYLTSLIGVPPCGGCSKRKAWLNAAHEKVRDWLATRRE